VRRTWVFQWLFLGFVTLRLEASTDQNLCQQIMDDLGKAASPKDALKILSRVKSQLSSDQRADLIFALNRKFSTIDRPTADPIWDFVLHFQDIGHAASTSENPEKLKSALFLKQKNATLQILYRFLERYVRGFLQNRLSNEVLSTTSHRLATNLILNGFAFEAAASLAMHDLQSYNRNIELFFNSYGGRSRLVQKLGVSPEEIEENILFFLGKDKAFARLIKIQNTLTRSVLRNATIENQFANSPFVLPYVYLRWIARNEEMAIQLWKELQKQIQLARSQGEEAVEISKLDATIEKTLTSPDGAEIKNKIASYLVSNTIVPSIFGKGHPEISFAGIRELEAFRNQEIRETIDKAFSRGSGRDITRYNQSLSLAIQSADVESIRHLIAPLQRLILENAHAQSRGKDEPLSRKLLLAISNDPTFPGELETFHRQIQKLSNSNGTFAPATKSPSSGRNGDRTYQMTREAIANLAKILQTEDRNHRLEILNAFDHFTDYVTHDSTFDSWTAEEREAFSNIDDAQYINLIHSLDAEQNKELDRGDSQSEIIAIAISDLLILKSNAMIAMKRLQYQNLNNEAQQQIDFLDDRLDDLMKTLTDLVRAMKSRDLDATVRLTVQSITTFAFPPVLIATTTIPDSAMLVTKRILEITKYAQAQWPNSKAIEETSRMTGEILRMRISTILDRKDLSENRRVELEKARAIIPD
jgi:hypothetical protein